MLNNYDDVLGVQDLCKILHIGRNTAYRYLNSNLIRNRKVDNKYFILKSAVIDFLNEEVDAK